MPWKGAGDRDYFPHIAVDASNTGRGAMNANELVFSYWVKLSVLSGANTSQLQLKGPRGGVNAENYYSARPQHVANTWLKGDGSLTARPGYHEVYIDNGYDGAPDHFTLESMPATPWNKGGWNFFEYHYKFNTPGVANGLMETRINGQKMIFEGTQNTTQCRALEAGDTDKKFNHVFLVPGLDGASATGDVTYELLYAEHYIDTTPQRVVITDNANYASSTNWVVQVCDAWADGSIHIPSPSYGTLAKGSTAYWHVFDASGAHVTPLNGTVTVP